MDICNNRKKAQKLEIDKKRKKINSIIIFKNQEKFDLERSLSKKKTYIKDENCSRDANENKNGWK